MFLIGRDGSTVIASVAKQSRGTGLNAPAQSP
ncbi:hypothetical protein BOSEA31B_11584 [Hyphomicrobiales bacterium]|nr:hypothetical protein BOSEA31B_11584 [Hyphomicrobiales bacterium]CAH1697376.1 hypothetical protein BOSEA1005_10413 [Hyphomicrobiales bacterium]CAI0345565.1 hypothetical protein BO1005MUT1_30080 [Hyphomicrobiales bacterium]